MEEETNSVEELQIVNGVFVENEPSTLEIPEIENPDDREYETVEIETEGGV